MKNLLLILLGILGCTSTDSLSRVCPETCYQHEDEWNGKGECKPGIPVCDNDGNVLSCEGGDITPFTEVCDGLDNDCDGSVDNHLGPFHWWEWNSEDIFPCNQTGECSAVITQCRGGTWTCSIVPTTEVCDGLDNDCNGSVDDHVYDQLALSDRVCYSGNPPDSVGYFPCHPGVLQCVHGESTCVGEQTPMAEECNDQDDDCDGVADNGINIEWRPLVGDQLFDVDQSGSMQDKYHPVIDGMTRYVAERNWQNLYGWENMTAFTPNHVDLSLDLTDYQTFNTFANNTFANWNGAEAAWESIYYACQAANPLMISWREDALRYLFVFTDEPTQIYTELGLTDTDIIDACLESGTMVFIWAMFPADYQLIAEQTGGLFFFLSSHSTGDQIFGELDGITRKYCLE